MDYKSLFTVSYVWNSIYYVLCEEYCTPHFISDTWNTICDNPYPIHKLSFILYRIEYLINNILCIGDLRTCVMFYRLDVRCHMYTYYIDHKGYTTFSLFLIMDTKRFTHMYRYVIQVVRYGVLRHYALDMAY